MAYRSSSGVNMMTMWMTIAGGLLGMVLGYLIANHLVEFDPLNILPLHVPSFTVGR